MPSLQTNVKTTMYQSFRKQLMRHRRIYNFAQRIIHPTYKPTKWKLITIEQSLGLASQWADVLPKDFDLIIGIPRAGLNIANIVASKLGIPLTTPDDFLRGITWFSKGIEAVPPKGYKHALIIEDTVNMCSTIRREEQRLKATYPQIKFSLGSLFAFPDAIPTLDYYFMLDCVNNTRFVYECSVINSYGQKCSAGVDFDGILCSEFGGIKYSLEEMKPHILPSFHIGAVITGRPENQRELIETWLKQHNLSYSKLIMQNNKDLRKTDREIAEFKAQACVDNGIMFFWESEPIQAAYIANIARIPVYVPKAKKVVSPK